MNLKDITTVNFKLDDDGNCTINYDNFSILCTHIAECVLDSLDEDYKQEFNEDMDEDMRDSIINILGYYIAELNMAMFPNVEDSEEETNTNYYA